MAYQGHALHSYAIAMIMISTMLQTTEGFRVIGEEQSNPIIRKPKRAKTMDLVSFPRAVVPSMNSAGGHWRNMDYIRDPRAVVVVDIGGTSTKAGIFHGNEVAPLAVLWDGSGTMSASLNLQHLRHLITQWQSPAAGVSVAVDLLLSGDKFTPEQLESEIVAAKNAQFQPVPNLVISFAAPTFRPGRDAESMAPPNLPGFGQELRNNGKHTIVWKRELAGLARNIFAANDAHMAMLGGFSTVKRMFGETMKKRDVVTFVMGTSINGGYISEHAQSGMSLHARSSWTYGRMVSRRVKETIDQLTSQSMSPITYQDFLTYQPTSDEPGILSFARGTMTDRDTAIREIQTLENLRVQQEELRRLHGSTVASQIQNLEERRKDWAPHAWPKAWNTRLPFLRVMENPCVHALAAPDHFLHRDHKNTPLWRHRVSQFVFGAALAFQAENGGVCPSSRERYFMLVGGNTLPLDGQLNEWVLLPDGKTWQHAISGTREVQQPSVSKTVGGTSPGQHFAVVRNYGPTDCQFTVVLPGKGEGNGKKIQKQWQSEVHMSGGLVLANQLQRARAEIETGRFVPFHNYPITEDMIVEF